MRAILFAIGIIAVVSCKNKPKEAGTVQENKDTAVVVAPGADSNSLPSVQKDEYFESDENLSVKRIGAFYAGKLQVAEGFDPFVLLRKILPGNAYIRKGFENDTVKMIVWKCDSCPARTFTNIYENKEVVFPGVSEYDTRLLKNIYYETGDDSYVIIPFYSAAFENTVAHHGRFNAPMLGMALLRKVADGYELEDLNMALGLYGSFGYTPQPQLVKYGKGNFVYIDDTNGPAGGPFYGDAHLFAVVKDKVVNVLEIKNASRVFSGDFDWKTVIETTEKSSSKFPVLKTSRKGVYSEDAFEDWEKENLPEEVREAATKQKEFSYEFFMYFRLENGRYVKYNSKLVLAPYVAPNVIE